MTDCTTGIVESGKAVQETAKAAGKAIDLATDFGSFIARHINGPLEQGMGIFEDKLRYLRWERLVRLMERADHLMEKQGASAPTKSIPLKLAIPLFQSASLEDNDDLQDLWARLLVNASMSDSGVDLRRAHIDILERISPIEAQILDKIYALPIGTLHSKPVATSDLPNAASILDEDCRDQLAPPSNEVILCLANLSRLGCVGLPTAWDGGEIFTEVYPAALGKSLVEACRLKG